MCAFLQVTEEMIQCLIKYIFDGLLIDTEVSPDFRSSSYAVVIVLLENAILSNKLLSGMCVLQESNLG